MSGFVTNGGQPAVRQRFVSRMLKGLSSFGMKYDDLVIKQSQTIGISEDRYGWRLDPNNAMGGEYDDYQLFASLAMADTSLRKNISFYDKSYRKKREDLRKFAVQDEIEDILDIICDDSIVLDDRNYFCKPLIYDSDNLNPDVLEKVKGAMLSNFKKIYQYFGFNDDATAWNYFRKWLIDGYLAFEIVYDEKQQHIVGFKELDPVTLEPAIDEDGKRVWRQFKGDPSRERKVYDAQIIYISWSQMNAPGRISYVERLVRAFNLLRIMEHSRVIWAVVNSSFKTKFIIPVGGKSKTRAAQTLAVLMQKYRENIEFDTASGELSVNGKPMMPFSKEYWIPESDSGSPKIETFGNDGPDLSDTDALKYFHNRLIKVSKIPMSRFDMEQPTWSIDPTSIKRDEMRYGRFITRIRSVFQEIMVKPMWLQMCLDFPGLKDDTAFKAQVGVRFNTENHFTKMANMEVIGRQIDFIEKMKNSLTDTDPNMAERKFWSSKFLAQKYLDLSEEDFIQNDKLKKKEEEEMAKAAAESPLAGGLGGVPGGPPGGGRPRF